MRLVFVADEIPQELLRIVEFLNSQMDPAEVLAVSVPQYVGDDDLTAYVPRLQGQTAQSQLHRSTPGGASRSVRHPLDVVGAVQRIEDCPLPDSEKRAFKQLVDMLAAADGEFFYTESSLVAWIWHALGSQANTLIACYDHSASSPDQPQGCVTWRLAYVRAGISRGDLPGDRKALLETLHEALNDPADSVTEKHPTTNVKGHLDAGQWAKIVATIEKIVGQDALTAPQ